MGNGEVCFLVYAKPSNRCSQRIFVRNTVMAKTLRINMLIKHTTKPGEFKRLAHIRFIGCIVVIPFLACFWRIVICNSRVAPVLVMAIV